MLNYENFKEVILEKLSTDYSVELRNFYKSGMDQEAFVVHFSDSNISPLIYIEGLFNEYLLSKDMDDVLDYCRTVLSNPTPEVSDVVSSKEYVLSNVITRMINTERNKKYLEAVVSRTFLDLSVIYFVELTLTNGEKGGYVVRNEHAKMLGISEEDLYKAAVSNTIEAHPFQVTPLSKVIFGEICDFPVSCKEDGFEILEGEPLYLVTNKEGYYAATCILYKELFKKLATVLSSDLILIPSSVHEYLAAPCDNGLSVYELQQMVREVNETEVDISEQLSNHVYRYNRETNEISLVLEGAFKL